MLQFDTQILSLNVITAFSPSLDSLIWITFLLSIDSIDKMAGKVKGHTRINVPNWRSFSLINHTFDGSITKY